MDTHYIVISSIGDNDRYRTLKKLCRRNSRGAQLMTQKRGDGSFSVHFTDIAEMDKKFVLLHENAFLDLEKHLPRSSRLG